MDETKRKALRKCRTFDELLDVEYGVVGSAIRSEFEKEAEAFCLAQTLKEERIKAGLTQEQLAQLLGTKKSYISRLENGKSDIQLGTLFRIFEGLGRKVKVTIV